MRLLVTGLGFFATALALAILPVVAQGGPITPNLPCTITGTNDGEILVGTAGRDVICALGGSDVITAKAGDDVVRGGDGADEIYGDWGSDALYGGRGNDRVWARDSQHDHVNCGGGSRDFTRVDLSRDKRVYCESVRH
jgi:Ca2+-binding RTX toxin-like protein